MKKEKKKKNTEIGFSKNNTDVDTVAYAPASTGPYGPKTRAANACTRISYHGYHKLGQDPNRFSLSVRHHTRAESSLNRSCTARHCSSSRGRTPWRACSTRTPPRRSPAASSRMPRRTCSP